MMVYRGNPLCIVKSLKSWVVYDQQTADDHDMHDAYVPV